MLKRRTIRTKVIVALTLLSAVVLLLASSGFWGLYRYRHLANAIVQRAEEVPLASDLHQLALRLQEDNHRINQLKSRGGLIEMIERVDPLIDLLSHTKDGFDMTLVVFDTSLDDYQRRVKNNRRQKSLLVDDVRQQITLQQIRQAFDSVDSALQLGLLANEREAKLNRALDTLKRRTEEHLEVIHEGMKTFSEDVRGQYRAWIAMAWSCTILAFSILAILLWSFRSLVLKPFQTLLAGSRLVAGGQFDHRIDLGTGDELSELADAMNEMTDRFQGALAQVNSYCNDLDRQVQQRTREVIQNEQLASVGFLSAGVAHEINNPLASIAWSAESLQSRIADIAWLEPPQRLVDDELCEALTTNLRRIEEEAYRCKGITEKLLDFSRLNEVRRASTDIVELVEDVVAMVGKVGKYRCKTLRTHTQQPVSAEINQQEIRQVVLNLVTNALESVNTDGAVDITVTKVDSFASVIVKDDGCGMSPEVLTHLFEPFFTRRRDGTGTGLGLSITYRIVSQHGGSLIAKSEGEGKGSELELLLPISTAPTTPPASGLPIGRPIETGVNHQIQTTQ